jgi:hypothetical protein
MGKECLFSLTDQSSRFQYPPFNRFLILSSLLAQSADHISPKLTPASTGNVSYICPSFHGIFGIPVTEGACNHTPGFTDAAGTDRAHDLAIVTAKGMAVAAWKILTDDQVAAAVRQDFEDDKMASRVLHTLFTFKICSQPHNPTHTIIQPTRLYIYPSHTMHMLI